MRFEELMAAPLRAYRFRQWDREGGPSTALRWSMAHPIAVTAGVAVVLSAVFAATFGVPPLSPFVLVVLLCVPILPWLRSQRRLHREWLDRDPDADPPAPGSAHTTPEDPPAGPAPDPDRWVDGPGDGWPRTQAQDPPNR